MTVDTEADKAFAKELSRVLQELHRALLHSEMGDDPVLRDSPYSKLFALIGDPRFSWMGVLSQLIARIDERLSDKEPSTPDEGETLARFTREAASLIGEGGGDAATFRMHHVMALQKDPSVGLATGRLRRLLATRAGTSA